MRVVLTKSLALGLMMQTVLCAAPQDRGSGRIRVVPRNEAPLAPTFSAVLARFERAVRTRNADEVVALIGGDIVFTFGDAVQSAAGFRSYWKLDDPASEFWTAAHELLAGPSAVSEKCTDPQSGCSVTYPYWYVHFPSDLDALEHAVVKGDQVPMYAAPTSDAPIVERLSYDVVKLDTEVNQRRANGAVGTAIILLDGRRGFLLGDVKFYQPIECRMEFTRVNGRPWQLTMFLCGD